MINFPDMPEDSWEIPGDNHSAFVAEDSGKGKKSFKFEKVERCPFWLIYSLFSLESKWKLH